MWKLFDINNLTNELYNKYFSMMSDNRKEKVLSLKDQQARKRTVAGEMLAKELIAEKTGRENIVIEVAENGKPYTEGIYFNISHTENIVVCVVLETPVGIDVERIKPYSDRLAKRITTEKEYRYINKDSEKLYEIWTLKEASLKKEGKGIALIKNADTFAITNKLKYKYEDFIIHIVF